MKIMVVSGGRSDTTFFKKYASDNVFDFTIACDKGMEAFYKADIVPDIIVGDFDSVSREILEAMEDKGSRIVKLIPEKDDTDTEAGIRIALENRPDEIHLLGATGTRIDHILGNIELLGMGISPDNGKKKTEILMVDEHNRVRILDGEFTIKKSEQYGRYVSFIPFTPVVRNLTLKGFKYELDGFDMRCFNSLGISNEILAEEASVRFDEGYLLMVESLD